MDRGAKAFVCRLRLAGLLIVGFGLVGCQTSTIIVEPVETFGGPVSEIGPLSSSELNSIGRRDLAAGNSGKAERSFREAVEKNDQDVTSWVGLAAAYDNLRRFDLADRAYANAIRLDGETLTIINNLGFSYLLRGDRWRALQQFKRAQLLDPGNAIVSNNILLLSSRGSSTRSPPR